MVHPSHNARGHMLRRGHNHTDGSDEPGRFVVGLFFIAFVRDPPTHSTPLLARMQFDLLTESLKHQTSSLFAVPPGLRNGETYFGQRPFEDTSI